jgi:predicted nucleic acid-binding Zn ribbon protein
MARRPELIGNVLSELMTRRGFARVQSARTYEAAWREAAGALAAKYTCVGSLQRGTLDVIVLNSTLVQEMTFRKPVLLEVLNELLPEEGIKDLRFRVG